MQMYYNQNMNTLTFFLSEYKSIITIIHVLGVVIGMGAALMSDFLFSFFSHNKKLSHSETYILRLLGNIVWVGLLITTISGFGIFLTDIEAYQISTKFLVKMSILAILLLNGYILHRYISKSMIKIGFLSLDKFTRLRKISFACGSISLISWVSVLALGVLNSVTFPYKTLMGMYFIVISIGIIVSITIEKNTLERK